MDLKALKKKLDRLSAETKAAAARACQKTATWAVKTAKHRSRQLGAVASREFVDGWDKDHTHDGAVVYNAAPHALFVEIGRRPGRMPPIGRIARWLVQKRLVKLPKVKSALTISGAARAAKRRRSRLAAARSMAFVIARAIGRRGIKGRHILQGVVSDMHGELQANVNTEMARAMIRAAGKMTVFSASNISRPGAHFR